MFRCLGLQRQPGVHIGLAHAQPGWGAGTFRVPRRIQAAVVEFEELYREHEARALRTAVALLGDHAAAEDAVQEAFVAAFRSLHRKRPEVAFATWLYRCLVWAARGQARKRRAGQPLAGELVRVEGSLERVELRLGLVAALAELPAEQREVLVLRYFLDLSEAETASLLRCRLGTVKSRAHRGLRALAASGRLAGYELGGRTNAEAGA